MDALQTARTVVLERHPDARAAFLGGSVLTAHRTSTSDLDIVIVVGGPPAPYRESLHRAGWPVEIFVHTQESWHDFAEREVRKHRSPLLHMCGNGALILDADGVGELLAADARKRLAAGPPPVTTDELEARRYALTDLLDDLEGCTDNDERCGIVMELARRTGELALVANGSWLGGGKWLARRLHADLPGFAERITASVKQAFAGDTDELEHLVNQTLGRVGGRLWAGYRQGGTQ